jgi:hypothetical protein
MRRMSNHIRNDLYAALQHLQPRGRGVQFGLRAILPHSNTPARNASRSDAGGPSLRVAGFEDETSELVRQIFLLELLTSDGKG